MRLLVSLVCVCALLGVVHIAAPIVIPLLLALALATAFQPISHRIARRGWPPAIAAVFSVLLVLVVVGGLGIVLYIAASDLVASMPEYATKLQILQERFAAWLESEAESLKSRSGTSTTTCAVWNAGSLSAQTPVALGNSNPMICSCTAPANSWRTCSIAG